LRGEAAQIIHAGQGLDFRKTAVWEQEHMKLLVEIAPAEFDVLHYGAIVELKRK